jgi:hypothetical protein
MPYDNNICPVCDKEIRPDSSVTKRGDKVIHLACFKQRMLKLVALPKAESPEVRP